MVSSSKRHATCPRWSSCRRSVLSRSIRPRTRLSTSDRRRQPTVRLRRIRRSTALARSSATRSGMSSGAFSNLTRRASGSSRYSCEAYSSSQMFRTGMRPMKPGGAREEAVWLVDTVSLYANVVGGSAGLSEIELQHHLSECSQFEEVGRRYNCLSAMLQPGQLLLCSRRRKRRRRSPISP